MQAVQQSSSSKKVYCAHSTLPATTGNISHNKLVLAHLLPNSRHMLFEQGNVDHCLQICNMLLMAYISALAPVTAIKPSIYDSIFVRGEYGYNNI